MTCYDYAANLIISWVKITYTLGLDADFDNFLNTVFPHIVSVETIFFLNFEIQRSHYIKVRKLFKGGNYSREETNQGGETM